MHATSTQTFVLVGAGQGGSSAALQLRQSGFAGRIVLIGEEPQLPYERPPLSKQLLAADGALPLLQQADVFARERIELLTGRRVTLLDARAHRIGLDDGAELEFDKLLLVPGGTARRLDIPGGEHAMTLRTWDDACALRERLRVPGHLAVVGAGVIGLEVAATARQLGWAVTVLEYGDRPLARLLPASLGAFVASVHRAAGVDLRLDTSVSAIEQPGPGGFEVFTGGARLACDLVFAGIGMQPRVELALQAGIDVDGAILVDECGRTSAADVYAAGDAASFWHPRLQRRLRLESWQHAAQHAQATARNMLGLAVPYEAVPWAWTDQYDLNLQIVGLPLSADRTVLRGRLEECKFAALHLCAGRLVGATLVNMGRDMRPCKGLIESQALLDTGRLADESQSLRAMAAEAAAAASRNLLGESCPLPG